MEPNALSLLNLLYLEDEQADAVIAAVGRWCADNECEIGSPRGSHALSLAIGLVKRPNGGDADLLDALAREMAADAPASRPGPVLVVEDEALIALDLEWQLGDSGFEATSFRTSAEARQWLVHNKPAFAIIDVQLKDGPCIELVEALVTLEIPFVVSSALPDEHLPAQFRQGILVPKPCEPAQLSAAFRRCMQARLQGAF